MGSTVPFSTRRCWRRPIAGRGASFARSATPVDAQAPWIRALKDEIGHLADAIARGALRASPAIAEKLRSAEEELAGLQGEANRPTADIEQLIPMFTEEIELAVETLPKTLAAGNVELARQELKGFLGSIRVVAEPTRMLLYSERGFVEAVLMRAAGDMASIVGSGGRIPSLLASIPRMRRVGAKQGR
jgi:hypothetical protein